MLQTNPDRLRDEIATRDQVLRIMSGDDPGIVDWSPHKPYGRGKLFIEDLRNEKEVFYGGAAGGMKSDHLLQAALEYVDIPGYAAILFRRTYKDLSKPEALMSRAHSWLAPHVKAKRIRWNAEAHQLIWAHSGAILAFGHLDTENDKNEHQSAAYQFIGFDELTQFSETQYTYLFSRLRRPQVPCAHCYFAVSQIDRVWQHSVDPDTNMIPVGACAKAEPDKVVLKQYGPSRTGQRIWDIPLRMRSASNPAEDYTGFWVAERFVPDDFSPSQADEPRVFWKTGTDVKGRTVNRPFVPSRLEDNPFLDRAEYENSLVELGSVTYEQLRRGDWQIRSKGNIFPMWNEDYHVVTWDEFERVFETRSIPSEWACGIAQDWGTTRSHPCVTTLFATAPENTPIPGAVFIPWALTLYDAQNAQQVARDYLIPALDSMALKPSIRSWLMSHEASSEQSGYNEMGLPFGSWGQDANGGLDRVRRYLEIRHKDKLNPFGRTDREGRTLLGCSTLMLIVNKRTNPKDDADLARHRAEFAGYSWYIPKAGDAPEKLRPQKLFNDAMDTIRCYAEINFPEMVRMTIEQRVLREYDQKLAKQMKEAVDLDDASRNAILQTNLIYRERALCEAQQSSHYLFRDETGGLY